MGHNLWLRFGVDEHPFATFDVHQGFPRFDPQPDVQQVPRSARSSKPARGHAPVAGALLQNWAKPLTDRSSRWCFWSMRFEVCGRKTQRKAKLSRIEVAASCRLVKNTNNIPSSLYRGLQNLCSRFRSLAQKRGTSMWHSSEPIRAHSTPHPTKVLWI